MHIEVQVALNFVISYLYNKLPRRRVNIFGEELEKALKDKFSGHWYPEKPFKGSAFRCLKTGDPVDPVLERAARESGVPIQDILENLPHELAVWVDPGEVSYRIGEKGAVKVLFSEATDVHEDNSADREVNKTFNPEAQCFRPIEAVGTGLANLSLSPHKPASPFPVSAAPSASTSPAPPKTPPSPAPSFMPRPAQPLTFTTATFAQTKFGSTKLKTNSKRANRMSPTEFSNYIKQRAMQQQLHHPPTSPGARSLSPAHHPAAAHPGADYFFPQSGYHYSGYPHLPDLYHPKFPSSYLEPGSQYYGPVPGSAPGPLSQPQPSEKQQLLESINNFGLASYPAAAGTPYQHLLVAN
ncbi:protein Tob1-like [Macrosteles quadrilineatus]|uniref:protein Tob1-like n=1 Tax=Macrosteles quadrilineatus TaxID=74068 RepID=UPI0023E22580|nr:protein Tob1-like [Macrosteles quadrilineatus]XP_054274162.1 protein Tob1-like [Macrosteles quadrilineatus]XP_054274168.1 protein Tob1-like [Macrosteles quadrilineatus]XP_054274177.1 protein Tob1-like [Macrosteles quadrilineatus]